MSILVIEFVGETGVYPRLARLNAPEFTSAQLTATGFANRIQNASLLQEGDFIFANHSEGSSIYTITITTANVRTFMLFSNNGEVTYVGGSAATVGNLPVFADEDGNIEDSTIAADKVLVWSAANPDVNENLVNLATSTTFTALNAGTVALFTPTGSKTYQVIWCRTTGGTNFSGGGGDRDVTLSATASLSVIPAATLQALATSGYLWGSGASFPYTATPASLISAANPLTLANSGGTTNYTAGSIPLQFLLRRVS